MIELNLIRENPEIVRADLKKRGMIKMMPQLEKAIEADNKWRILKKETDQLRHSRNELTSKIKQAKSSGQDISSIIADAKEMPQKIKANEARMSALKDSVRQAMMKLPNILHESVPCGAGDHENVEVRSWGDAKPKGFDLTHHGELATALGLADFERAVKISGTGFYYLLGELAMMDMALQSLAIQMLFKRGYTPIQPPLMMRREPYEGVTDLSDFEEVMYSVADEDEYLIATSEHPMAAMYKDEILEPADLPIKLAGVSPCFRREIGKHGLDERGLFRVHQFNKVEQFIFCDKSESWELHEELIKNAEDFIKELEIPYRIVNVCTGDMGTVAAKKYDLEGYSPRQDKYIELVSCSNCTSYQATRLGIRTRCDAGTEPVHTLNSTMCATSRTLRLILENYQREDGSLEVPKALRPFMLGIEEIGAKA